MRCLIVLFCLILVFCVHTNSISCDSSVLDDYIARPEPLYAWNEIEEGRFSGDGYQGYLLNMTSQQWLTPADVSRSVWFHYILVAIPDKLNPLYGLDTALLYATNGNNNDPRLPKPSGDCLVGMALTVPLGLVAACLLNIPNQPIVFSADPDQAKRTEDNLIAFAWKMFLENPDRPEWLPRLPMVKACVKAMDTVQVFADKKAGVSLTRFIIGGASKRGWTAWLAGAIQDPRVIAILPIVMSDLNFNPNIMHHYKSLGGWSFALEPYWKLNFTQYVGTDQMDAMMAVIDPFSYADRLVKIPKFQIIGSGDEFFLPDDDSFWLKEKNMLENTYIRIMPNCEHSMAECIPSLLFGLQGWIAGILYQDPQPPAFTWTIANTTGDIILTPGATGNITGCRMWYANTLSTTRRDFRLVIMGSNGKPALQGVWWKSTTLTPQADGTYIASMPVPATGQGWSGHYIEIDYASFQAYNYRFTTEISILPQTFPFAACGGGLACKGTLV